MQSGNYTLADILSWPEDERWELIDGVDLKRVFAE